MIFSSKHVTTKTTQFFWLLYGRLVYYTKSAQKYVVKILRGTQTTHTNKKNSRTDFREQTFLRHLGTRV